MPVKTNERLQKCFSLSKIIIYFYNINGNQYLKMQLLVFFFIGQHYKLLAYDICVISIS